MDDRRIDTRLHAREIASLTLVSSPGAPELETQTFHGITRDVSNGGLGLRLHANVPIGSRISVKLRSSDPKGLYRRVGSVVWKEDVQDDIVLSHQLGIRFSPNGPDDEKAWKSMMARRLQFACAQTA